jgi:hypothetical protein
VNTAPEVTDTPDPTIALLSEIRDLLQKGLDCQAASAITLEAIRCELARPRLLREHLESQGKVHLEETERECQRQTAKEELDHAVQAPGLRFGGRLGW